MRIIRVNVFIILHYVRRNPGRSRRRQRFRILLYARVSHYYFPRRRRVVRGDQYTTAAAAVGTTTTTQKKKTGKKGTSATLCSSRDQLLLPVRTRSTFIISMHNAMLQ